MSQWIAESFVPPTCLKLVPSATWTVPSIFSSKLRSGGRIELDGKIVQENGVWAV